MGNKINSQERLDSLHSLDLLDTLPEKEYDAITELAAIICKCPIALISLVAEERQFFKSHYGLTIDQTPIEQSFCAEAIRKSSRIYMVEDARKELLFQDNPLVLGDPHIVFYAGVPLIDPLGEAIGTLSIIDIKPRILDEIQIKALNSLANQVIQLFELRKSRIKLQESQMAAKMEAKRLGNIIEATRVGTWEWNIQTGEVNINERWAEIGGYTREELEPIDVNTWLDLIHPDDKAASDRIIKDCFDRKIDYYDIECRMMHKNGSIVWINDRGKIISWTDEGKPLIMTGTHTDISFRKNTEIELAKALDSLHERVKEQTCLYHIANLSNYEYKVEDLLNKAVGILPTGFLFSEIASAKISYREKNYTTPNHQESPWILSAKRQDSNGNELKIEVAYQEQKPQKYEGPFQKEERQLLEIIADNLMLNIKQILTSKTIEQNEKRFRSLIENSADSFAILGLDGKTKYVSPSITNTLGYTEEEALQLTLFEIIHPDDQAKVSETLGKALENPGVPMTNNISRTRHKDGSWKWMEATITNMLHDPDINGIVDNFRDLTDHIKNKKEIQESNERYEYINKATNDAIYDWDIINDLFHWGEGFYRIFAFDKSDKPFRLTDWAEMMNPFDRKKNRKDWQNFLSDPNQFRWNKEFRIRRGDGGTAIVEEIGHMVRDSNGKPIRMVGVLRDVTQTKELQNLLDNATQLARVGGWEIDLITGKLFISKITKEIHELPEDYQLDLESAINFYKEGKSRDTIKQKLTEAIENGTHFDVELKIITAKGNEKWVRSIGNADFEDGKCVRLYGSFQDIHRRKSAEESQKLLNVQLEQHAKDLEISNKELEQFAYVASHDLQEPLRMVTSFLAQLEKKYQNQLDEKALKYIHFAVDGAKRMRQIILDLLEYSRIGKGTDQIEDVDINEIVEETCLLQQKNIEEKKGTVIFDQLPKIKGHRGPILQLFQNLIGNALKYSRDESPPIIRIKAKEQGKEWLFSVEDNGIGIPAEFHEKIFIIFQRLHIKEKYSGTGMGLAIVKKIIENMGGEIWLESKEGKGSTFYFTFPKVKG